MHDAGRGDYLIGRIAPEVQAHRGPGDVEVNGSDVQTIQSARDLAVVEIHLHPPELDELGEFPLHEIAEIDHLA